MPPAESEVVMAALFYQCGYFCYRLIYQPVTPTSPGLVEETHRPGVLVQRDLSDIVDPTALTK